MTSRLFLAFVALSLAACASSDQDKLGAAAATPLNDLNLVSAPIPDALARAQRAPYAAPAEPVCDGARAEIRQLDEVLGADLDAPPTDANPGLIDRGSTLVASTVQRTVEGAVPFRGWVRKLSGAERYSKQVTAAIAAGTVRRGFLKGVVQGKGC